MPKTGRPRKTPKINGPLNDEILQRMRDIGARTWQEFADHFEIGRTTLHSLMVGRQSEVGTWISPTPLTLNRLAVALNMPVHEIYYRIFPEAPGAETVLPTSISRVPVVGFVGAGPGSASPLEDDEVTVSSDFARDRELRAYYVTGHSMCAGKRPICDGDVVIIDTEQTSPHSGQVVVARLKDDSHVVKAYKEDKFGIRLQSTNPLATNGTPPYIPIEDVAEICGVVVKMRANVGTLED